MPNRTRRPLGRDPGGTLNRGGEGCCIVDHVVRRHDDEDAIGVAGGDGKGGDGDRGRGIARDGLEVDRLGRDAGPLKLLANEEPVVVVAQQNRARETVAGRQAPQRRAEKARIGVVEKADELLGVHGPRERPQAGARAARKNDWK